jgi:hypothetical protein
MARKRLPAGRQQESGTQGESMTSLLVNAVLGLITIGLFFYYNAYLYRSGWKGSGVTWVEALYYAIALCAICAGWYFNTQYMHQFPVEGNWWHFTKMMFANPAAASIGQDLCFANVLLLPLWTMVDGPRRGLKGCWLYFVMSLFTSFAFAMGLYLAAQERQVRWQKSH